MDEVQLLTDVLKTIDPKLLLMGVVCVGITWKVISSDRQAFREQSIREQQLFSTQIENERKLFKEQAAEDRQFFQESIKQICETFEKEVETCQRERQKMMERFFQELTKQKGGMPN